jgi:hypothetical protein
MGSRDRAQAIGPPKRRTGNSAKKVRNPSMAWLKLNFSARPRVP